MKARPILFSAPMIRALLDGRKTQTRRVIKPQPDPLAFGAAQVVDAKGYHPPGSGKLGYRFTGDDKGGVRTIAHCPYGQPGDLLWVRETHYITDDGESQYAVCAANPDDVAEHHDDVRIIARRNGLDDGWVKRHLRRRPSIHMPRWASRLTLEVTDIRVERLQDISEEDAIAEGIDRGLIDADDYGPPREGWMVGKDDGVSSLWPTPQRAFQELWTSINGPESWAANPWVWALTFDVHRCNVDTLLKEAA